MFELYNKSKEAWHGNLPKQLYLLVDCSNESTFNALKEVLGDLTSESWLTDSKIAWRLMQEYGKAKHTTF